MNDIINIKEEIEDIRNRVNLNHGLYLNLFAEIATVIPPKIAKKMNKIVIKYINKIKGLDNE